MPDRTPCRLRTRFRTGLSALAAAALCGLAPAPAAALDVSVGPRVGLNVEVDTVVIGGDLALDFGSAPVGILASGEVFLDDVGIDLQIDLNGKYYFPVPSVVEPFVGGGLAILHGGATEVGGNIIGGVDIHVGPVVPFALLRYTLWEGPDMLSAIGGVRFTF